MNDEQFFLANAYLDGELTDDEQTFAEADPVILAEVVRLRALQSRIRTVGSPSSVAKERAINAALGTFRVARVTQQPTLHAWRHQTRLIGVAAAIVAIGLLGTVIARGGNDSDEAEIESSAGVPTVAGAGSQLTRQSAVLDEAADSATYAAAEAFDADAAEAAASTAESAEASAQPGPAGSARSVTEPLTSPADLAAYAASIEQATDSVGTPISPETRCPFPSEDDPSGVIAQTTYVLDGVERDVLVAVDRSTGQAFALDPTTCLVVVEGPRP